MKANAVNAIAIATDDPIGIVAPLEAGPARYSPRRSASTAEVRGFNRVVHWNHAGAPATGKTAPDSIQMGSKSMFMNAWKPCVDSVRHAIASPMLVIANAITAIIAADTTIASRLRRIPARAEGSKGLRGAEG